MEIQTALDQYRKDIKAMTQLEPKDYEIGQVAHAITSLPERKWKAAEAVALGTIAYKDAKAAAKNIRAAKMLEARHRKDDFPAADDRKAYAETHPDVQAADRTLINADAELTSAKLAYECLDDLFTGYKKIMEYLVDQEQATRQYNRFVDEAKRAQ